MGNTKQKKQATNVVKSAEAFKKKKVKVGKTLKKTNMTNTEVRAHKLTILHQFNSGSSEPHSHRGLTVHDLMRQIGHTSQSVRRDAVAGLYQLLKDHPEVVESSLHELIGSVARLISNENFVSDSSGSAHFKLLAKAIFAASYNRILTSFELLVTHLRLGLSHIKLPVRTFALEITLLLFDAQPKLCSQTPSLYEGFLAVMKEPTKRPANRTLLADAVRKFRFVYDQPHDKEKPKIFTNFRTFEALYWFTQRTKFTTRQANAPVITTDTSWLDKIV